MSLLYHAFGIRVHRRLKKECDGGEIMLALENRICSNHDTGHKAKHAETPNAPKTRTPPRVLHFSTAADNS